MWVRLSDHCGNHPDCGKQPTSSRREFIGYYMGNSTVNWLSPLLPATDTVHWGSGRPKVLGGAGCLIPVGGVVEDAQNG